MSKLDLWCFTLDAVKPINSRLGLILVSHLCDDRLAVDLTDINRRSLKSDCMHRSGECDLDL
jgi:hypothetical protein